MKEVSTFCLVLTLVLGSAAQEPAKSWARTANMSLIPGTTFERGIDSADIPRLMEKYNVKRAELFQEETPKHGVTIKSFYMDRTEVTNAQFKIFLEQHPEWRKEKIAATLHNGKYLRHWNGNDFPTGQADYPVVFVSWYAATAFCNAQGKRLPTEAEWEFAARGGLAGKEFPWGDELPDKARANFSQSGVNEPVAVGSYVANGYSLHDMAGNVWEYLADEWQKYPGIAKRDDFLQVKTRRSLRGGSYGGSTINLRVTYRDSHLPENAAEHVGFRCAMTSPVQSETVNELLRMHHRDRVAHFDRDAGYIFSNFADEYFSVGNGNVRSPDREAGQKRMQAYLDASTFLEWDDITPPIIRLSDDETLAYVLVHKRVRLLSKEQSGKQKEEIEVFAWSMTLRKISGKWKVTSVTSTNTAETDK